jgi:hypothetical protein
MDRLLGDTALVDLRQIFLTVCAFNYCLQYNRSLQYNDIGVCVTYHFIHWYHVHLTYQQELCQMGRWRKFKGTFILFLFLLCVN